MMRLRRAAALLAGAKSGDKNMVLSEAKADKESDSSWSADISSGGGDTGGDKREGASSYHKLTLVSHQKLSRAASVGLAVGFTGGLLWVLREHTAARAAVASGAGVYVLGVILRGPADWLPVVLAALAAAVAGASYADWSGIGAAFERIPDTYKPFSRVGRPVGDGAMSKALPHVSGYTGRPNGQSSEVAAGLAGIGGGGGGGGDFGGGGGGGVGSGRGWFGVGGGSSGGGTFFGGTADASMRDAVMHAEMSTWQRRRQLQPGQMGELVRGVLSNPGTPRPGPLAVGDIFGPPAATAGMGVVIAPQPKPGDGSFIMGRGGGGGGGYKPPGMSGGF